MARVDPFVIQWPRKWIEDPDLNSTIQYLNKFLYELWIRTGGGTDDISNTASVFNSGLNSTALALLDKVSLGDEITVDTSGFTVDTTFLFADMSVS